MRQPSGDDLRQMARHALGPDDGDRVVGLALPAVRLERTVEATGRSRLGGRPILDGGQQWPRWGDRPLSFVALLDVEDFADLDVPLGLPRRGLLNFFYEANEQMAWGFDPNDAEGWRIVLADPELASERDRPAGSLEFTACPFGHRRVVTLPDPWETVMEDVRSRQGDRLYELFEQWQKTAGIDEPHHQLGGWPNLVQNPLQTECQLASDGIWCGNGNAYQDPQHEDLRRGAVDWRLLLQVDSDDAAGWMWGDSGSLYYCIKGNDADAAALEAAWMIFQCC